MCAGWTDLSSSHIRRVFKWRARQENSPYAICGGQDLRFPLTKSMDLYCVEYIVEQRMPWPRGHRTFFMFKPTSMKFVLLINLKLLTNTNSFMLNIAARENFSAN